MRDRCVQNMCKLLYDYKHMHTPVRATTWSSGNPFPCISATFPLLQVISQSLDQAFLQICYETKRFLQNCLYKRTRRLYKRKGVSAEVSSTPDCTQLLKQNHKVILHSEIFYV